MLKQFRHQQEARCQWPLFGIGGGNEAINTSHLLEYVILSRAVEIWDHGQMVCLMESRHSEGEAVTTGIGQRCEG